MKKTKLFALTTFAMLLFSCEENENIEGDSLIEIQSEAPIYIDLEVPLWSFATSKNGKNISKPKVNKPGNREVILYSAEYMASGEDGEVGNIIFFNNRGNKQLGADFVADSQYNIFTDQTNDVSYYIDESRPSDDLDVGTSTQAVERSMTTWNDITCSELGVFRRPFNPGVKTGVVAGAFGYGDPVDPIFGWVSDVVHAGWLPLEFFDDISGGRGANILATTFTFVVVIDGVYSDDDNNGLRDVWFREIYYNDNHDWADGTHIDVETVALHESGHGLSQGHFGKAFFNKGGVHFSPRAVMNASYSGIQTSIEKTDEAGHCSNWAAWPEN